MSEALSTLHASLDAGLGGVLLANMVEAWLAGNPDCLAGAVEVTDEPQDHGTAPEQTRLHLCAPVDECPGAPPSGEHGAPVCTASDGAGTGLTRIGDSHARSGSRNDRHRDDEAGGLQDSGGGCGYARAVSRWVKWAQCLRWKFPGWRARISTGIGCWSCARLPRRW